jgi:hypothetical protein
MRDYKGFKCPVNAAPCKGPECPGMMWIEIEGFEGCALELAAKGLEKALKDWEPALRGAARILDALGVNPQAIAEKIKKK